MEGDVVIPAVDFKVPLDPCVIRPWIKVEDRGLGEYFYNVETGAVLRMPSRGLLGRLSSLALRA
jgi:hypothetical protein